MAEANRRLRKRKRTTDHITSVAFALFERHGYEAVTMEQIAAEADVARGTLYNHFPVKEAVLAHELHSQLERALTPLMEQVLKRKTFRSRLAALLDASARWWEEHRQYAVPYIRHRFQQVREGRMERATSEMVTVYDRLIAQAQENGELASNESSARLALYLHYLYLCALIAWIGEAQLRDEFAHVLEFFMRGAASSQPSQSSRKRSNRRGT